MLQLDTDNPAIAGEDFEHVDTTVEFASGETEVQVTIPIIDDVFPEDPETFEVFLSESPGVFIQSPAAATILINDRDPDLPILNVSFVGTMLSVREGVGVVRFTVEKSSGAVGPISIRLFTNDDSALAGSDYEPIDQVVTFETEELQYEGRMIIIDNDALENVEQLILQIESIPGPFPVEVVEDTIVVTITDNDIVVFSFEQGMYSLSESAGFVELQVVMEHGSIDRTVTLQLTSTGGTASEREDYIPVSQALEFSPGISNVTVRISIVPDDLVEPNENFFVDLTLTSQQDSGEDSLIICRNSAQITIQDDDTATIGIVGGRVTTREGGSNPRFSIMVISGQLGRAITLAYSTYNINATAGADYIAVLDSQVTLTSSSPSMEVVLEIIDDSQYEGEQPESFGVQLSLLSGANTERVLIQPSIFEVLIEDNEPRPVALVGFSQSSYTVAENAGSAVLLVTSDGSNHEPVEVTYTVLEEDTQDGIDVMRTSGSFIIHPEALTTVISIPLTQDTSPEDEEIFAISLLAGEDISLTREKANVTILDTDVANCGPLADPLNGVVSMPTETVTGAVAIYSCDERRALTGSVARVCSVDGLWTPAPPTCEALPCGQLVDPPSGQVTVSGTTLGSRATYTCDMGYTLTGPATLTCSSDGAWRPAAPTCLLDAADCGPLTPPANGAVNTSSGTTVGSVALYSCDEGFLLTGTAARVCGSDGVWVPAPPTCEAADCGLLSPPANGAVDTSSGTTVGSVALYSCNQGYTLTGSAARVCGNGGVWIPAPPTCRDPIGSITNPASSCRDIPQGFSSGLYWINSRSPIQVYCDMNRASCSCSTAGGWMRVANFDMTDPTQNCPAGFRLVTRSSAPQRTCGRPGPAGCVSTTYSTHGVEYSRVCGRVIGYQDSTPDAFYAYHDGRATSIDSNYVDGVSLTHGQSPRQHIWTFAATLAESQTGEVTSCPCIDPNRPFPSGTIPPFVGQDYLCDSGNRNTIQSAFFPNDPLWDGQGCGGTSNCCGFNNPPWFCKQLPQPTTDNIELRLCADQDIRDEDTPIERVEIFVN